MKALKIILPVVLTGAISLSWFQFAGSVTSESLGYQQCIQKAEESKEKGLYEQAIECYKEALDYKYDSEIYAKISETCEEFYSEEETSKVRNLYIKNMIEAAEAVPEETVYWIKAIELYKEKSDYASAYSVVKKARNSGAKGEELDELYKELRYMILISTHQYHDFKTALNGYFCVYDSSGWQVTDNSGKTISTEPYQFIGILNDDGSGIYINDIDTRLLDKYEIVRARFDFSVDDAGIYSSKSGYIPVLKDGKWKFADTNGNFLPGEYEMAGSFMNQKAAVKENGKWHLIDEDGKKVSDDYEDIKLDLYGSYVQNDVILAKAGGKYHIYTLEWEQVNDFSCDDIDICMEENWIAYKNDDKWGFIDNKGNVMIEPMYQKAKSFSNGMAAVYNGKKWGFVNTDNDVVVDYQFQDAYYFNDEHYCIISTEENTYQFMHLMFE